MSQLLVCRLELGEPGEDFAIGAWRSGAVDPRPPQPDRETLKSARDQVVPK